MRAATGERFEQQSAGMPATASAARYTTALQRAALAVAAVAALHLPASAQPAGKMRSWRTLDVWRQPEGLPQNTVFAIHQTRDGYIWVGTRAGLARFDGVRFAQPDSRALRENEVWALAEAADSSLWMTVYGAGVARLKGGRVTTYTSREGLSSDFTRAICAAPDGAIWIGTDHGLNRMIDGRVTVYTTADGLSSNAVPMVYCDSDGSVLLAVGTGSVERFDRGRIQPVGVAADLPIEARYFLRTRDGRLWVATADGLFQLSGPSVTRFTTSDGLSSNVLGNMSEDAAGNLWVTSDAGVDVLAPGESKFRSVLREPSKSAIHDREGNVWLGSTRDGLRRLAQEQFVSYTTADGLPDSYVSALLEDRQGAVWAGTAHGVARIKGATAVAYGPLDGISATLIGSVLEDRRGTLWAGLQTVCMRRTTADGAQEGVADGGSDRSRARRCRRCRSRCCTRRATAPFGSAPRPSASCATVTARSRALPPVTDSRVTRFGRLPKTRTAAFGSALVAEG